MRQIYLIILVTILAGTAVQAQSPQAFQYQAVVRDSDGELLKVQNVALRLSILQGDIEGESVYTETHSNNLLTNEYGMVTLMIGQGSGQDSFSDIDWSQGPYYLKVELDIVGFGNYMHTGTSQLLSVPYSLYAEKAGSVSVVKAAEDHDDEEPVFQVKNKQGQVLFAVYESGVVININEDSPKGTRAGFAVGGFNSQKDNVITDYLTVERDHVQVYLDDDPTKGTRGGFAVGGFSSQKMGMDQQFMLLTPENFFIWLDQDMAEMKGTRGGFAVGGFSRQKQDMDGMGGTIDYLRITPDSTRLWFDDSRGKGTRAGFAVGGFSSQKSGELSEYLSITPDRTSIFINPDNSKGDTFGGFSVTGFDNAGVIRNLLRVTRDTTYMATTIMAKSNIEVEGDINLGGRVSEPAFTDERDGKRYRWIQIGNQTWMAENLKYEPGGQPYAENPEMAEIYGYLYRWTVASGGTESDAIPSGIQGVCPAGWHLPSEAEWQVLTDYLRGEASAGLLLKEGPDMWDGSNESRFYARPGGRGQYDGWYEEYSFYGLGTTTGYWTTTQSDIEGTVNHFVRLDSNNNNVSFDQAYDSDNYHEYHYVRCVKN